MTRADEDAWLAQAANGDRDAFDAFVRSTAGSAWTVVRKLTADEASAEDALQETYIAAWRGAAGYRGASSARSWLYGLARRQAARTWRRRAGEPIDTEPLTVLAERAGWGQDPEALAARAEDRTVLLGALAQLSAKDQEVLTRCDLEGRSAAEVASELNMKPGAVRVRLHRARLRLMGALGEVGHA